MSMYLPNPDVGPTGFETVEFLDIPSPTDEAARQAPVPDRTEEPGVQMDHQTLVDISQRAHQYISSLVKSSDGDLDDVRSVVLDLYRQSTLSRI